MPYQRLAQDVLVRWRAIERQLEELSPTSPEADELKLESYRLRNEYQELIKQAIAHHRPEPPPFPGLDHGGHEHGDRPDLEGSA